MSSDAIVILKNDHKELKRVFRAFEKAGDNAVATKRELVDRMIALLTTHTYLENEIMYPRVRTTLPDLEDDVLESYEEHHVADVLCRELAQLDARDNHFDAKVSVLIENVEHHIGEEEDDWFPKVREGMGRSQLRELGEAIQSARPEAPTNPTDPKAIESARIALTA